MPYEQHFNKKKKKNNNLVWIAIIVLVAFSGLGALIYFTTKNKTTENKTPTTEQRVQQLQNQLVQIRTALATLTTNIAQTETSLQTKRTEHSQTPTTNLQTEINQLESQLTTYKTQKQKIETLLPKIQEQINNLAKGTDSESKNQEDIIQNLEKDIQEINQELGIKTDKPKPTPRKLPDDKKGPFPRKDDNPPQKDPNSTESQNLRENAKSLNKELGKLTKWMDRHLNDSELRLGTYHDEITTYLDTIKNKKKILEGLTDYTDVSSIKEAIKSTLKIVWECFYNSLCCKIPADFLFHEDQKIKADNFKNISSPKLKDMTNNQDNFDIDSQVSFTNQLIREYDEIYKEVYEKTKKPDSNDTDDDISDELPSTVDTKQAFQILIEIAEKLKKEINNVNDEENKPISNINLGHFSESARGYFLSCNDGQQKEMIKNNFNKIITVLNQAKNVLGDFSKNRNLGKIAKKMNLLKPKLKGIVWKY